MGTGKYIPALSFLITDVPIFSPIFSVFVFEQFCGVCFFGAIYDRLMGIPLKGINLLEEIDLFWIYGSLFNTRNYCLYNK